MSTTEKGSSARCAVAVGWASCGAGHHDFAEEYYGWKCKKCGLFYPNTCPLEDWLSPDLE